MEGKKETLLSAYLSIKNENKDAVVFYQIGGFYQMFYHDALLASRELGIRLLSRAMGGGERAPMCGVPAATVRDYAQKLAGRGFRVVLCAQVREESGACRREITEKVQPEGKPHDLTQDWDAYFKEPPPLPPAPAPAKRGRDKGLMEQLAALDVSRITPMQALEILCAWKERYCGAGDDGLREDM